MRLANLRQTFLEKYGNQLLPSHLRALDAITACKNIADILRVNEGNATAYNNTH